MIAPGYLIPQTTGKTSPEWQFVFMTGDNGSTEFFRPDSFIAADYPNYSLGQRQVTLLKLEKKIIGKESNVLYVLPAYQKNHPTT